MDGIQKPEARFHLELTWSRGTVVLRCKSTILCVFVILTTEPYNVRIFDCQAQQ